MSEKTIAQKLLIKPGYRVLITGAPEGFTSLLGELPPEVGIRPEPDGPVDLAQVFVTSQAELTEQLDRVEPLLKPSALLWITYPKGTSGVTTDLNRAVIREYAQSVGFQAVAMVSVDATWSAPQLKSSA